MPTRRVQFGNSPKNVALITYQDDYKVGDQPPADKSDYLAMHEWAEVQLKGKLRQTQCGKCGGWKFPQELSGQFKERTAYKDKAMTKPITIREPICNDCMTPPGQEGEG